jgi:hypothetical protein
MKSKNRFDPRVRLASRRMAGLTPTHTQLSRAAGAQEADDVQKILTNAGFRSVQELEAKRDELRTRNRGER